MNKIVLALTLILLATLGSKTVYAADTYPFPNGPRCGIEGCQNDGWGFYIRQCTSYAAWKMNEGGAQFYNSMPGPNGQGNANNKFGNALNWNDQAAEIGMAVDSTPMAGDIAVFEPGQFGATALGHVAFVESVNANGSVNVSEYNYNPAHGYGTRFNLRAGAYVHLLNNSTGCSTNNAVLQSQTISAGNSLSCYAHNSIQVKPGFHAQTGSHVHLYIN